MKKLKRFFLSIWQECKDFKTFVLFLVVVVIVYSPVWGGYLLYWIFKWEWCLAAATLVLAFWAGPFTPFFPICIAVTLAIKKLGKRRKKKTSEMPVNESDNVNHGQQ